MMEHKIAYELIEEFVFGTLSQTEHEAVAKHLETGCDICLARELEVAEVSIELAEGLVQENPATKLRVNLLNEISREQTTVAASSPATPIWSRTIATLAVAASILLLIWANSLRTELSATKDRLENSQTQIARLLQDSSVQQDASYLFSLPCTKMVSLNGVEPNETSFANVVLHPDENFAVAYIYRMPPAPAGKEYQLWVELDGEPISVGVFSVDTDGEALVKMQALPAPLSIGGFQVTIEPQGGLDLPSGMLYLTGQNVLKPMQQSH